MLPRPAIHADARMAQAHRPTPTAARVLLGAAVVFIVYGSLFPFDFQATGKPASQIFEHWHPWLDRADAIDNFALFVPLGLALHFSFSTRATRWLVGAAAWLALGLGLQWAQLFVPGRVASVADAINNAAGFAAGVALARLVAPWLARQRLLNPAGDLFAFLLVCLWYVYESYPFVPTLDLGLLREHLKPLVRVASFDAARLLRHAVVATLGTVLLLRSGVVHRRRDAVAGAAAVLLLSELLVPYGSAHRETLLGIVVGLVVGERLEHRFRGRSHRVVLALALLALALSVATPLRGQAPGVGFTFTPFAGLLWFGTTSGIPPAAFEALTIGALLWSGTSQGPKPNSVSRHWPWVVLALLAVAEVLRIAVFAWRGDTTIFVLWALLAALASHRGRSTATSGSMIDAAERPALASAVRSNRATEPGTSRAPQALYAAVPVATTWLCLTLGLWLVLRLPTIPYNLKELLGSGHTLGPGLFALALLWIGAGAWWVAACSSRSRLGALWLPVLVFAAAMVSLLLLSGSVTRESLDDITGSPDLYRRITQDAIWGASWHERVVPWPATAVQLAERALRYAALYALLLIPLSMVAVLLCRRWTPPRRLAGLAILALLWWPAKWVVIEQAITDNLTELISVGGVPYLAGVLILLSLNVAALVAARERRGLAAASLLTALCLPTAWWLLIHGLEPVIIKYDLVFSALQFLLGQNRSAALPEWQLFLRWCALYLVALGIIAWGMRLARRVRPAGSSAGD